MAQNLADPHVVAALSGGRQAMLGGPVGSWEPITGRCLPIIVVLALVGSLAQQRHGVVSAGTLPTHRPLCIALATGVALVLTALTFIPALALGPLTEGLHTMP